MKKSIIKTKNMRPDLYEDYVKKKKGGEMNTLEKFEKDQLKELHSDKNFQNLVLEIQSKFT